MKLVVLAAILLAEIGLFAALGQSFELEALSGLLVQAAPVLVLAFGMTLVLTTAGIDLSVGSMTALVACIMASTGEGVSFWWTAMPLGLVAGLLLGAANGALIAGLDMPPIIATLGTMILYRGLAFVVLRDAEKGPFPDVPGYAWLGEAFFVGCVMAILYGLGGLYLGRSRWRQELRLIGGNRSAGRYAGLAVPRRLWEVYTLVGGLAFLAAVLYTARNGSVSASALTELELKVVVAVVLGGTKIDGGGGSLPGTFLGAFIIAVLDEGMRSPELKLWGDAHLPFQIVHLRHVVFGCMLVLGVWLGRR